MSKKLKVFLIVLLILLLIVCTSVIVGYLYLKKEVNRIKNDESKNEIRVESVN